MLQQTDAWCVFEKPPGYSATDLASFAHHTPLSNDASGLVALTHKKIPIQCHFTIVVAGHIRSRGRGRGLRWTQLRRTPAWTVLHCITQGHAEPLRPFFAKRGSPVWGDGQYGDPLDRRAARALVHCHLIEWQGQRFEAPLPPDFARFIGDEDARTHLPPKTTAYRQFNGAVDGFPGWVIDRYADWQWVQHDQLHPQGPLPDARGTYIIRTQPDRSRGAQSAPILLKGEPAPPGLVVQEHGVRYAVELGAHLSTGLFLDQRPQRTWLAKHAGGMRVLNTFAHAGGFSIAAATAGATTVSIDLSKQWLARIAPQLVLNGVDPASHDTIYGDCFDWLRRLSRRGEQFDLVILDPPSTSVGRTKKRWSAAKDYGELARIAAPLVAPGGLLWTATNHRKTSPHHFAQMIAIALPEFTLERVCPPAVDYPTDEPFSVKTHVWRNV